MSGAKKVARRHRIQVDDRTHIMGLEVLMCRANTHPWMPLPLTQQAIAEAESVGLIEVIDACMRCEIRRRQGYALGTGDLLYSRIDYRPNPMYLLKERGNGKLSKAAAKRALLVRRVPEFAA